MNDNDQYNADLPWVPTVVATTLLTAILVAGIYLFFQLNDRWNYY